MFGEVRNFGSTARNFLIATFLMGLSNGMFDAVYNFYLEVRGLDKTATGHIYAIAMMIMAAAVTPLIFASRRMSQKKLLLIFAFIYSLPFILLPVLTTVWASAITLGLILSGMIAQLSLGNSLMGSNIDARSRTTLFSCFFVSYLGAAMTGSFVVSLITHFSQAEPLRNYQGVLATSFIFSLLMIYFRVKSIQGVIEPGSDDRQLAGKKNMEWANFIFLFIAASLLGASITIIFRFINIVFSLAYSMNVSEISLIMGGDKIVSMVGALFAPLLVQRFSLKPTVIVAGVLTASCLLFQSLQVPAAIFIILYFMRLLLNYCLMPLLDTLAITGFSKERTLLSTSIRQLSFYLGSALSAVIYGDLLDGGHWEKTLIISAGLSLAGAIFMSLIRVKNEH
ncbi:TPA: MFS transporter [Yersinia enterocolitica]|uniref:MFS transporter n=1 Tax=Yersinia enterocolitica TaxID=630 RepID=UPI002AC577D6|nr:MFS transporter [Yersinia enterocolitica]HDM8436881.1 MFS transporter [Yersinia enterocolitica]HEN3566098.1 MFS transporter [Yersinia enterocolitica]HEN3571114.1 MFS transporter [Yersinia enterocolitica]HEN3575096.1 MFS transporter [Yersinia enterocolitica]